MKPFSELEKETNKIVIVDTNRLINLEKRKCSLVDLKAINRIFDLDICPFITDLSFCDLVLGCRDVSDFKLHIKEINDMEFIMCGSYEPMCNFLQLNY